LITPNEKNPQWCLYKDIIKFIRELDKLGETTNNGMEHFFRHLPPKGTKLKSSVWKKNGMFKIIKEDITRFFNTAPHKELHIQNGEYLTGHSPRRTVLFVLLSNRCLERIS
jgi:hypothetical protein